MEQPSNCPFCHKCSVDWPVYLDEIHQFNADIYPEVMYQWRCSFWGGCGAIIGTMGGAMNGWIRWIVIG